MTPLAFNKKPFEDSVENLNALIPTINDLRSIDFKRHKCI